MERVAWNAMKRAAGHTSGQFILAATGLNCAIQGPTEKQMHDLFHSGSEGIQLT